MLRVGCCTPAITCGTDQDVNKPVQLEWFKLYPAFILLFGDVYFTNTNTFFPLFRTLALNDPQLQGLEAKTHIKLDYPTTKILPNLQQDHKVIVLAYVKICFDSSVLMVHVGCTPVVTFSTEQKMTILAWIALELVLICEYIFFDALILFF